MSKLSPILHQQPGAVPLHEFAALHCLSPGQAKRLLKKGQILGAQQTRDGKWWVYPPAKLLRVPRKAKPRKETSSEAMTARVAPPSGASVPAAASCGRADTHPMQAANEAAGPLHADQQAAQQRAEVLPEVFHSPEVLKSCRIIQDAASRPRETYRVELTEVQMLMTRAAIVRAFERTEKDIKRGRCTRAELDIEKSLLNLFDGLFFSMRKMHLAEENEL